MLVTILLIGGGLAIVLLVIGIIVSMSGNRTGVDERLNKYLQDEQKEPGKESRTALTDWFNKKVEKSTWGDRIARNLARADLKFKSGEYIALYVIAIIGGAMIFYMIGGRLLLSGLIGAVIGGFLPGMYVRRQQNGRLKKFNDQLPDMLNLMVNGLRAGYSTLQAMEAVSKELPPPICNEFRRVVQEMQLGIPMEKALANLLRRIPSEDLDFVITSINVQREVGGNLAEIMEVISFTIRERIRIKGEVSVLTSQARYSGQILALMPLCLLGILYFLNRSYLMTLFSPENVLCGSAALVVAIILIVTGYITMMQLSKIEV
jgi:tight adherence protein B